MSILTDNQRKEIAQYVTEGEELSGCEFVSVIVSKSGRYPIIYWKTAVIGILTISISLLLLDYFTLTFFMLPTHALWAFSLTTGLCTLWFPFLFKNVQRKIIGRDHLDRQSLTYARDAFLQHEIFDTSHRMGILIYISVFERKVHIIADFGLDQFITEQDWKKVIKQIRPFLKKKEYHTAIIEGIKSITSRIMEHPNFTKPDSTNELTNNAIDE